MVDSKKLPAVFYATPSGNEPVRDWLLTLNDQDRRRAGIDIATVEFGWPIGMPLCRSLQPNLWEIRSNLSHGRIARVMFTIANGRIVLLHSFVKKSRKTPKPDMDLAMKRKQEIDRDE